MGIWADPQNGGGVVAVGRDWNIWLSSGALASTGCFNSFTLSSSQELGLSGAGRGDVSCPY